MSSLVAALLLGIVAGLRTLTAPAVLLLLRGGGWASYLLVVGALLEDAGDLNPKTPSRTAPVGLIARLLSGGFCGWWLTAPTGASIVMGVLLGACGAVIGAYGGLSARKTRDLVDRTRTGSAARRRGSDRSGRRDRDARGAADRYALIISVRGGRRTRSASPRAACRQTLRCRGN